MDTKITGLTFSNVRAIRETMTDVAVETTSTTATFHLDPAHATQVVGQIIARLPGRGHPKASLHAVLRKLQKQITPVSADDPNLAALRRDAKLADEEATRRATADAVRAQIDKLR